jgi:sugar phosphate isomerase/epimerase
MYSFSSCWNSHRHVDGRAMLHEIRELGFEQAELSHGIRVSLLPGIMDAVSAGEIRISSVHNFCPLPMGVTRPAPNLFKFSAPSARERENAWRYTLKTLDFAARVKASVVVLHLGSIEMKEYTGRLKALVSQGLKASAKYEQLCRAAVAARDRAKERPVHRVVEALNRLAGEAETRGLKLGVENREALEEIPVDGDWDFLFHDVTSAAVGYWHDTGHAQIKENLGLIHHRMQVESLAQRLFGFHVHDVQFPASDHAAPGSGMIDFAALRPCVTASQVKVFELSPALSADEVRQGVAVLKAIWGTE